ncbi:hypothetical protein RB213_016249, partial [Colletotrichum asianum]
RFSVYHSNRAAGVSLWIRPCTRTASIDCDLYLHAVGAPSSVGARPAGFTLHIKAEQRPSATNMYYLRFVFVGCRGLDDQTTRKVYELCVDYVY